ncbi:MAG: hypothetical protein LBH07_04470 [Treponema sp.]|jgi:hypothetical protein|nr:hypothetical protein [Treponema sp.]
MNKHINYEDNIFILNIRIRMIQDLLILDTDADLFLNKTLDDLDFINSCLTSLLLSLKDNSRLIERDKQFYNLAETERQFHEILNVLDNGEGSISALCNPELRERTGPLTSQSQERQSSIKDLIIETKDLSIEPVVGYDEMQVLLSR